jgi:DedD protein
VGTLTVKERLTGAMILVALIVLLVPELLSGPIRPAAKSVATESSAEDAPLRSYTIHLADDAQSHGAPAAGAAPLPAAATAPATDSAPPPVSGAPAPTPPPETPRVSEPPPSAPAPAAPPPARPVHTPVPMARPVTPPSSGGAYVVQLGSFASDANAERLAQQVRAQGFTVAVSQSSSGRHLYRVRVGPVKDRAAASQLAQKLSAGGHAGSIEPR